MLFYPSKVHRTLNKTPFLPEVICGRAMFNPKYKVDLVDEAVAGICDSGAFQDRTQRLPIPAALERQLAYEQRLANGTGWRFQAVVTYDQMLGVDEQMVDGKQVKRRGTEESARPAIAETLRAAEYYATQRHRIAGAICFSAQGVTPRQYVQECVVPLLDLMQPTDWFAFGGFCIIGMVPSLKPLFVETVQQTLPLLARKGVRRAHLLGVGVTDMVRVADELGQQWGIEMSTDTSSIEVNSVLGKVFDDTEGRWRKTYTKADKYVRYFPCQLAHENIARYNVWAQSLDAADSLAAAA